MHTEVLALGGQSREEEEEEEEEEEGCLVR